MKKPSSQGLRCKARRWSGPGQRQAVAWCAVALLTACTGTIDPSAGGQTGNGDGNGDGNGSPSGTGATNGGGTGGTGPSTGGPPTGGTGSTGGGPISTGGAGGPVLIAPNPPPFQPAAGMLRRLTRTQFRNAVKDVFNVEVNVGELDADSWNGYFANIGAATVVTSERGVEQYQSAIETAVNAVFADATKRMQLIGCAPTGRDNDTCIRTYLQTLGMRAWRRPLEAAELTALVTLATKAATDLGNAIEGARWATVALFTSPHFLYRPELGAPSNGSHRYTGHEMASRLSFLIWNSIPDKMLLDQASTLVTPDGIRAAAIRMLDAPAGREAVASFAEDYMRMDRVLTQAKDGALFPDYTPSLQSAMARDMRETWAANVFDDKASALDLFTTTKVYVNSELAKLYGIDATGLTPTTFAMRSLPADGPRAGILTKAGFLSQFANQHEGSPTLRGKFIRDALLCTPVPAPPGDVDVVLDDPPADMPQTKRQRLEMHRTAPACANCHAMMDPLGLPLENFDAIGKYRTTDHGLPIDASSEFDGTPVANARELGVAASKSIAAANCLVRRFYTYALGYQERREDGAILNTLAVKFQTTGFKLRELILDVVTSDAFTTTAPQP